MAGEKLCLKWNDFQKNLEASFAELKDDRDFTDVTLACEDQSIQAHKVILSAGSPFFKKLLKAHSHAQPLIYMRGIRSSELTALVDFIYLGEASIFQEQLESFLALAEELELNGLTGSSEEAVKLSKPIANSSESGNRTTKYPNPSWRQEKSSDQDAKTFMVKEEYKENNALEGKPMKLQSKQNIDPATLVAMQSMMEKRDDGFACNQCDYASKRKDHVKEHVEKHIEGLEYPCNYCNKVLRSANAFRSHQRKTGTCFKENIF